MDVALCKIATIGEAAVIIWFFVFSSNIISPKPQYRLRARPDNQREERLEEKAQGQPEGGRLGEVITLRQCTRKHALCTKDSSPSATARTGCA